MGKFNNNKDFDTSLTLVNLTLVNHVHVQPLGDDGEHGRGRQDRGRGCDVGGRRGHRGNAGRHSGMGFGSVLSQLIWIFRCVQYLY